MAWLRENGIATPPFRFAAAADEAVAACAEIGFPVRDEGGLARHPAQVRAWRRDRRHPRRGGRAGRVPDDPRAAHAEGAELPRGRHLPADPRRQEVLVGLSRDPQFGPVIAFGLGGIYTEVLRDVALRVAPVDRAEADAMIRSLRAFPILAGARGQQPCDLDALADLLVRVSELPFRYPEIAELDLNPVFAGPDGAVAGDVRIITQARP